MSGDLRPKKYDTKAIRLGYKPSESNYYSMMPPITMSATFEQQDPCTHRGYYYTRYGNPSRSTLQTALAVLEDSKHALCYSSGSSAINAIVHLLNSGDHIVSSEVMYGGTYNMFDKYAARAGITTTYVDSTEVENVEKAIQSNTKLVWLETPSNPLLSLCDIAKISEMVHKRKDIMVAVDNTFLTSYFQKPLSLGADIVAYSLTKYINGHTDVCMGAVCFNRDDLLPRLANIEAETGLNPSPFDCYLVTRSLKTLPIRMRQHQKTALKIAQFLETHPHVKKVMHPLLPSHPQHELAKRQSSGHSGMVSFFIEGGIKEAAELVRNFRVVNMSSSLGGVESCVTLPRELSHVLLAADVRERIGITDNLVRMSFGLEDVDDLIEDMDQALRATFARS